MFFRVIMNPVRCCRWCGTELSPYFDGLYCSDAHRKRQGEYRRKMSMKPVEVCPTPFKVAYPYRGEALRAAVVHQQCPYLCQCSVFHLTSQLQETPYDDALRALIEEMSPVLIGA